MFFNFSVKALLEWCKKIRGIGLMGLNGTKNFLIHADDGNLNVVKRNVGCIEINVGTPCVHALPTILHLTK